MVIVALGGVIASGGLFAQNGKETQSGNRVGAIRSNPAAATVERVAENNPVHQPRKAVLPDIVAEVNGQQILRDDLRSESLRVHGTEVLDRIENRALVLAECKRRQVNVTKEDVDREIERLAKIIMKTPEQFLEMIQTEQDMTPKEYTEEVIWPRLALQTLVSAQLEVSDEEIEREYLKNYGPSLELQMISLKTKEEADDVYGRVTADPDSFGEVAKNESTDVMTASNKGRMRPIRHYSLPDQELEETLFALQPGEISNVIGPYGPNKEFLIFRCVNHYDSVVPQEKMEEIKGVLRAKASDAKLEGAAAGLFEKLKAEAKVTNVYGNPEEVEKYPNVAAIIGGQPIYLETLIDRCVELYGRQDLEGLILFTLLKQEAKKVNLTVTEQDIDTEIWIKAAETTFPDADGKPKIEEYMKRELAMTKLPEEVYRTNILWPEIVIRKLSAPMVEVTDEDLQKGFEANFGESIQCLGIVLNEERRARDVWQQARTLPAKENKSLEEVFGDLAAKYSVEPGSKQMRGEIAPITKNGGMPNLENEAFSLKPGELSSVIQIDRETFVILYCKEILPAKEVSFDEVKDSIANDIRKKKEILAARQYISDLYKRSTINNFLTGQKIAPQAAGSGETPEPSLMNPMGGTPAN